MAKPDKVPAQRPVPKGGTRAAFRYPLILAEKPGPARTRVIKDFLWFVRNLSKVNAKRLATGLGPKWRARVNGPTFRRVTKTALGQPVFIATMTITLTPPVSERKAR